MLAGVGIHKLVCATSRHFSPRSPAPRDTTLASQLHLHSHATTIVLGSLEEAWGEGLEVKVAAGPQEEGYGVWGLQLRCLGVCFGGVPSALDTHLHVSRHAPFGDRAKRFDQKVLFPVRYRGVHVVLWTPSVRETGDAA